MTEHQASYAVGYGKPPRQHQWRPGQSGNPAGRTRKKRERGPADFVDGLVQALLADRTVVIDGSEQKKPAHEIVALGLVRDLLKATGKEKLAIIRCLETLGVFEQLRLTRQMMASDDEPIFIDEDRELLRIVNDALSASEERQATADARKAGDQN